MPEIKAKLYKDGPFEIATELAGLVPMACAAEQAALTLNIQENGLREPVVLWKGKIVDGRCRQKSLRQLKQPVQYKELDDNLTYDEVAIYVKSVNTRRNLTLTQKCMVACKESLKEGNRKSVVAIAKAWGISKDFLVNARYLAKNAPQYVEPLFNGETVTIQIITKEGMKEVETDKISTIAKAVKMKLEAMKLKIDKSKEVQWKADSEIKTEAGKKWYAEHIEMAKQDPISYMVELANHRYSIKDAEENEG